jgi:hypothetical protein
MFGCAVRSFTSFNAIIRIMFTRYHEEWEKAGKPEGFLYFPEAGWNWQGAWVTKGMVISLLITTPHWANNDEEAIAIITRFRRYVWSTLGLWILVLGIGLASEIR